MRPHPKILLTGRPGIGKTTVIRRFLELTGVRAAGFFTQEIRRGGTRFGFSLNLLSGRRYVLASVEISGPPRVSKYGVDLETFDSTALPELERGLAEGSLLVIDEIGKMELFSERFRRLVRAAVDSPAPLLGTILERPHPFADEIRRHRSVEIIEVNRANRDRLPRQLAERFGLTVGRAPA